MKAPFPWFGGKSRVADVVWRAFGADVPNYVEPFYGSGAVLLGRPGGAGKIETANDRDRYVANFWRAVVADPLEVARHADWPVNEADLHARHQWLCDQASFRERKPLDQALDLVSWFSNEGETVLDLFAGAGTFGLACALLGRGYIGFEIDGAWAERAAKRIDDSARLSARDSGRYERWQRSVAARAKETQ